jgi:predicted nucleic acid-binding protein
VNFTNKVKSIKNKMELKHLLKQKLGKGEAQAILQVKVLISSQYP